MGSLEACFSAGDEDVEKVTFWYVELLGANEQADKLFEQLDNEVC